ncbi:MULTISPECIES: spermidine/putrescine ABC transporter permease PotB [unclassified Psychrobacter]|uniref:spermidine/putrescine ABC transporter permease PotB n=1 Tax=unclassified Psychrobacter TaxID=196806 RepID=UPI000C33C8B3|nr:MULTISPECIES: spermidine/putrescine ABC transporter permease PotB [unclassified Psychrobacter]MBA6244065.1 spermidine/putrescine ABC transporter permease PotB [Psychrobacter sp. Urea-trap-18]MBA6287281.1 spermidine/putrescine ABC transporter permease PotB [Psychrobacter sp. Urea-trap-16]MBA6318395.1 spermidine/putrescine ABC transporter permease PotB [Psychrobacter sp. Urea-trap-20]MBA6335339.1 spermidine/putrescine ABC transporter permease PotB [Psychrobacter sp. Urea-trap-19]PKG60280.1 sp
MARNHLGSKSPFRTATLWLIWGWLLIFALLPNILVIAVSFLTRDSSAFISLPVSIDSYVRMIDPLYFEVFVHSLWMAGITTVICLLLGYPFAWLISKAKVRWQPLLMLLLILPFWTNSLVRTYALKLLFANNGLINKSLLAIGVIDTPIDILYTQGAVIAGLTYLLFPFMVLPLYAVFTDLRNDMLLASQDLGATKTQTFWHVVLPLTTPGIISGVLLVLLPAMGMFYVADILGGSRNLLVGNIIKNQFLDARDWPFGAAASVLLTLAMAVLLLAYHASSRRIGKTDFNEVA